MAYDSREALQQEYFHLQKVVEEFDGKALTIKAWSVTLSAAGIVTAYTQDNAAVLLIAAGSPLVFWLVEALWKTNQQAFYRRIHDIEEAFRNHDETLPPLQIATSWGASWRARGQGMYAFSVMLWPHVFMPHVVVAAVGGLLYIAAPPTVT